MLYESSDYCQSNQGYDNKPYEVVRTVRKRTGGVDLAPPDSVLDEGHYHSCRNPYHSCLDAYFSDAAICDVAALSVLCYNIVDMFPKTGINGKLNRSLVFTRLADGRWGAWRWFI